MARGHQVKPGPVRFSKVDRSRLAPNLNPSQIVNTSNIIRNPQNLLARGSAAFGILSIVSAVTAADLASTFDASTEAWRTSTNTATLTWQATGGMPDGYLRGSGTAGTNAWFFVSPAAWAGDWSGYKVLKFDFSIPSRHYPDAGQAGMVVIVGTNGQQMTWSGSTPLWTWTHYEVDLSPAAFSVDSVTFSNILSSVAELRILAEFTASTEIVGLDNVVVTATPPQAHETDLVCRFTDGTIQGWRPVDDVTLSVIEQGMPSFALKGDDWMDGRVWKAATPVSWAGDWRKYQQLSFDMRWTGEAAAHTNVELVRIFGANGQTLSWSNSLTGGVWTHRVVPLTPEAFGVGAAQLEATLAHVSEMWIVGEFGGSDDIVYLDNIMLTTNTVTPVRFTRDLVSRFDAGTEGWVGFDYSTLTWATNGGISGGGIKSVDSGGGTARFQSPDAWIGDWRAFKSLRFVIRPTTSTRSDFNTGIWIVTWSGSNLNLTLPKPYGCWTPYTVDLTPETFGVSTNQFDAIMSDVACLWINADLISGTGAGDTTLLDNVMLLTDSGAGLPPDRAADFESGNQGWRYGGWVQSSADWTFASALAPWVATGGNPGGHLENTDTHDWTYWFTPESWAGDWRGLESVSFDFKILQGTSLFGNRMISLCSPWTNLHAAVTTLPVPGQWMHYEFALTPDTFGVPPDVFEKAMRDVVLLGIRSEWIDGAEREALDNYRLSKASDAYWAWISGFYSGSDLTDENKTGKLADPDADGMDNWSEFIAGTAPNDALDLLRIEHVSITSTICALAFKTHTGRLYGVETTTALSQTNTWSAVTNDIPGTGVLVTVPVPCSEARQFYRLNVRRSE